MAPPSKLDSHNGALLKYEDLLQDWVYDISEWLGLASLSSPRVKEGDDIDSYLSRYALPEGTTAPAITLRVLRWKGFITPDWITALMVELM